MHSINWCLLGDSIVYTRQEFSRDVHQMGLCSHIYFDHILPSFNKLVRGYRVVQCAAYSFLSHYSNATQTNLSVRRTRENILDNWSSSCEHMDRHWCHPREHGNPWKAFPFSRLSGNFSVMGFRATETLEAAPLRRASARRVRRDPVCSRKPLRGPSRGAISGYRFYNPRLGMWITRDPIKEKGFKLLQFSKIYSKSNFSPPYSFCFINEELEHVK